MAHIEINDLSEKQEQELTPSEQKGLHGGLGATEPAFQGGAFTLQFQGDILKENKSLPRGTADWFKWSW